MVSLCQASTSGWGSRKVSYTLFSQARISLLSSSSFGSADFNSELMKLLLRPVWVLYVLRIRVRLCRRLGPVRAPLQWPFGDNVLYRDSSGLLLPLRSIRINVAQSNYLLRRIHQPRDRRSLRQHRVGRPRSGSPPSALPGLTPPELYLALRGLCKVPLASAVQFVERCERRLYSTGLVLDRPG